MPSPAAEILRHAAELNLSDTRRRGNVVYLQEGDELLVGGDIHGNRHGLAVLLDWSAGPAGRVVLQEIIHGPLDERTGQERSVELLLRAARAKTQRPNEVLFVLGNHDVAQLTGNEITKNGMGVCKAFAAGLEFCFGDEAGEVAQAVNVFLMSMPLAVRCPGGVMISHSLPSPHRLEIAGYDILDRPFTAEDLLRGKPVYEWTWGRDQSPAQLSAMAERLEVDFFLLGHRHEPEGFHLLPPCAVTLNSDHSRGVAARLRGDEPLTIENCPRHLVRLAKIGT